MCLTSFIIRELQIKMKIRYLCIPIKIVKIHKTGAECEGQLRKRWKQAGGTVATTVLPIGGNSPDL